ncbi:hypothetical protein OIU74_002209 [Salix koriyanagi]|uniref:Uncharacterized protein n=1 Tax=Salix koriyanagi TaxID=2511006 RepID=A0A9Q0X3N3_9ROSI|nr:hypothetical protein OIU74_002209 [Salix koriyanagi]
MQRNRQSPRRSPVPDIAYIIGGNRECREQAWVGDSLSFSQDNRWQSSFSYCEQFKEVSNRASSLYPAIASTLVEAEKAVEAGIERVLRRNGNELSNHVLALPLLPGHVNNAVEAQMAKGSHLYYIQQPRDGPRDGNIPAVNFSEGRVITWKSNV